MKILNPLNQTIGNVEPIQRNGKNIPFSYIYKGSNNITFPLHANDLAHACFKACKFFGEGYSYLLFTL